MNKTKKRAAKRYMGKVIAYFKSMPWPYPLTEANRTRNAQAIFKAEGGAYPYDLYQRFVELAMGNVPKPDVTRNRDETQLTFAQFQYFYPKKDGKEYQRLLIAQEIPCYIYDLEEYRDHCKGLSLF